MHSIPRAIAIMVFVSGLGIFLVACIVAGGLYLWAARDMDADLNPLKAIELKIRLTRYQDVLQSPAGPDDSYRRFEIVPGEGAYAVAVNLLGQGLITDPNLFVDYVRFYGLDSQLEAGTYFLRQTQTLEQIAYALTDASTASIPFRTIAGWRLEEVAEFAVDGNTLLPFSGAEFRALVQRGAPIPDEFRARVGMPVVMSNGQPPSLEGFLFPGDYRLQPDISAEGLRDALLEAFSAEVSDAMAAQAAQQGLTLYEVVTLASIVQREAVVPEEASLIASVYLNRLARNMRLDADPTVQYAIGFRDGRWWPRLSGEADYYARGEPQADYAYNTYLKQDGMPRAQLLPPGPICSPGLAAINAVLNPAQTQYLYFRSCDDQTHIFSLTFAEHASVVCP